MIAIVAAGMGLVGGYYLSRATSASTVQLDGQTYYETKVSLTPPPPGVNSTSPVSFEFNSYNFTVELQSWYTSAGGKLFGVVIQPNQSATPIFLGGPPSSSAVGGWEALVAAGQGFAVIWNYAFSLELLVQTSAH